MAFDWRQFVALAKGLAADVAANPHPEAAQRTAISRAYFGAFGYARDYAAEFLGFEPHEHQDDHGALRAHLRNRRRRGDAQRLDDLRSWRNVADHASDLSPLGDVPDVVANAILAAERVFASLMPPKKV